MNSGTLGLVLGLSGFLLGGYAIFVATDVSRDVEGLQGASDFDKDTMESLVEETTTLREGVASANRRLAAVQSDERQLRDKVKELLIRLEDAEARLREGDNDSGAAPPTRAPGRAVDIGSADEKREEFEALRKKIWSGDATLEEQTDFWELARTTGMLDDVIAGLEADVKDSPGDADTAMRLASAYTAKLLAVPNGPERGAWAMKGEAVYEGILKRDPEHWDAGYSLAFSWSQWPAFMNKGPAAIKQFEKLRDVQESRAAEPKHAGVYVQLATLYRAQGNVERAQKTLEEGLDRHPDSEELQAAHDAATK